MRILHVPTTGFGRNSPNLTATRPFKSSSWSLTSGIPATTRALDFSTTTRAIVRKTPKVSQLGSITGPNNMDVFMSNNPGSPSHWLSRITLDMNSAVATASRTQSLDIEKTYTLHHKCNYQTCNGCIDLNVQRLCYGAQQCTIARCV